MITPYAPFDDPHHDLGGDADAGVGEVAAAHVAAGVAGAHVQVQIRAVGERAVQGYDLVGPLEAVRQKALFGPVEHAHGEVVHRAEAVDLGQADALPIGQQGQLRHDVFARVEAHDIGVGKPSVIHVNALLQHYINTAASRWQGQKHVLQRVFNIFFIL